MQRGGQLQSARCQQQHRSTISALCLLTSGVHVFVLFLLADDSTSYDGEDIHSLPLLLLLCSLVPCPPVSARQRGDWQGRWSSDDRYGVEEALTGRDHAAAVIFFVRADISMPRRPAYVMRHAK